MKNELIIAAYAEGAACPPNLASNLSAIKSAGWTNLMVSLFQVSVSGDISINGMNLISKGKYIGDTAWPNQLTELKLGGTIKTLLATFGGWDSAFANIQEIYNANNTFEGTQLEQNCKVFRATFPMFDLIDMDVEYPDGQPAGAQECFIAFCKMWIAVGYNLTFCPYENMSFWTNSLIALEQSNPGAVKYWNLQCYAGGAANNPKDWAQAITTAIPGFDVSGYLMASDWTRFWNGTYWDGACPSELTAFLESFTDEPSVGGGFIWTIDQILSYSSDAQEHPDPNPCAADSDMEAYVAAIKNAFPA